MLLRPVDSEAPPNNLALAMERKLRALLPGGEFPDVPAARMRIMSAIKGRGNRTTELRARAILARAGLRGWSTNVKLLRGKPDFFFPEHQVAIFVDGCYWHGCRRCGHIPKTNSIFWSAKLARNRQRDRTVTRALRRAGIRVLRVWEHELRIPGRFLQRVTALLDAQP
ncbi:very short patch repair endonuclease [Pyxidicoccus sp. 3LG]